MCRRVRRPMMGVEPSRNRARPGVALDRAPEGVSGARVCSGKETETMTSALAPAVASAALSTGVTLPFVEQGDPAGMPVVLLHGLTDSWQSFAPVLPFLPASIRAFAVTQRGHGDADRP